MSPLYTNTKQRKVRELFRLTGILLFAVYLLPSTTEAQPNITRIEYYLDVDPGFGNATNLSIPPLSNDIQDAVITIDPGTLSMGVHRLYVRARDANGSWSLTNLWLFYKPYPIPAPPSAPVLAKMSKLEYYFDNDPGYGNGIPVALDTTLSDFADYIVPVNVTGLATGNHTFWVRGLDKNGKWSMMNDLEFTVPAMLPTPSIVVNSITDRNNCALDSFLVSFDATGTYNAGNVFNAELTDANGSFASPVIIGSYSGTKSSIMTVRIPDITIGGTNFKVRVRSTNPVVTGLASDPLTIGPLPRLGLDTTVYQLCPGETTDLTALYNTTGFTATWNTATPTAAPAGTYRLIANNIFGCSDTAFANVKFDVATWTGAVSNDWHTAGNWNTGKVPIDKTHVIIPGGTPNPCVIGNGNASAASIQARNGAIVQATNNRTLIISGKCTTLPTN